MTDLAHLLLFAGRTARLEDLTRQFRERGNPVDPGTAVLLLTLVAAVVLVAWAIVSFMEFRDRSCAASRPWLLLWSLSRAHGLRLPEIWFLWRLARYQQLTDPALLFLDPERLNAEHAERLGGVELLEPIRARLFAGLEDDDD